MLLLVIEISDFLSRVEAAQYTIFTQKFHSSVSKTIKKYNGEIHKMDNNTYWVVFTSVNDAIQCTLEVQHKFKYVTPKHKMFSRRLKMALSVSEDSSSAAFESTTQLCELLKDQVVITSEVKALYESKNLHAEIDNRLIRTLHPEENQFLKRLTHLLNSNWHRSEFSIGDLSKALKLTYSQVHRRLLKLTGKTPNNFIKEFRLHKALELLHLRRGTITKIARQSGFNSLNYFSECFLQKYGVRPSKYLQQHSS